MRVLRNSNWKISICQISKSFSSSSLCSDSIWYRRTMAANAHVINCCFMLISMRRSLMLSPLPLLWQHAAYLIAHFVMVDLYASIVQHIKYIFVKMVWWFNDIKGRSNKSKQYGLSYIEYMHTHDIPMMDTCRIKIGTEIKLTGERKNERTNEWANLNDKCAKRMKQNQRTNGRSNRSERERE